MLISKEGKRVLSCVVAVVIMLVYITYVPKTVYAGSNDTPDVSFLGATLRLEKDIDNSGVQSMRIGIRIANASKARSCAIKLALGEKSYTVSTEPAEEGKADIQNKSVHSKDYAKDSVVYAVVLTNIPENRFDSDIEITGYAYDMQGKEYKSETQTRSVNYIVNSLKNLYASLGIHIENGKLYKQDGTLLTSDDLTGYKDDIDKDIKSLDISDGNIVISASGYTINGGSEESYTGSYIITGNSSNSIQITGGTHDIVLNNVTSTPSSGSPIDLSGDSKVVLQLEGTSTLTAKGSYAGINVPMGSELKITGDGTLKANGGSSSAGIGASYPNKVTGTLGKIVIMSGTILAQNSGGNGAGIGDSQDGAGGGEITIYGGSICAKSGRNGAGIGGGGSAAGDVKTITVNIYGGIITAGGSAYEIGDGKGQNHCEVYVYGGSIHSMNQHTLFGSKMMTEDTYEGKDIELSKNNIKGIKSVTLDGKDCGISSIPISNIDGKLMERNVKLKLYMTKADSHTVVITDNEGIEHTFSF